LPALNRTPIMVYTLNRMSFEFAQKLTKSRLLAAAGCGKNLSRPRMRAGAERLRSQKQKDADQQTCRKCPEA
jgi:hypothetical protein